jgi:hypothetical protein
MIRLLERSPASPEKAETRQEHPPMSGPEKGNFRSGDSAVGTVDKTAGHT